MHIKEAAAAVGCTCRAIKHYEERGLLRPVSRSENGYRDYSEEDIRILHNIQAYRKLGIGLNDIQSLLTQEDDAMLLSILEKKKADLAERQLELDALDRFIQTRNGKELNDSIDFASIRQAIMTQLPGLFGAYLCVHFSPYLNISLQTEEQKKAYQTVLSFWDNPQLHLPLSYRISMLLSRLLPVPPPATSDEVLKSMLHPSAEEYEHMKSTVLRTIRMRENPLIRFNPFEISKRSMMKRLRDCGYYDVFLPAMERLSPPYKAYRDALQGINDRLCRDLNLYYDSDFHLRIKSSSSDSDHP